MNTNETLQQLQQLKLQGMHNAYSHQLELPVHQQLEAHELVGNWFSQNPCIKPMSARPITCSLPSFAYPQ